MRKRWMAVGLGLVWGLGGCATAEATKPKPRADCEFSFYETQEPTRSYEVIGEVPLTTNEWMNMAERKALLASTVCAAKADGVILGAPTERKFTSRRNLREYRARLLVFNDKRPAEPEAPPPLQEPPLPPGTIPVPVMLNGLTEEPVGVETRKVAPPP
jgi:hypothetical protein